MITFPSNPILAQEHTSGGILFTFNGAAWVATNANGGGDPYLIINTFTGTLPTAAGQEAIAIGDGAVAGGNFGIAIGEDAETAAAGAIAIGSAPFASGNSSIAVGINTSATGASSVAFGRDVTATATGASAFGAFSDALHNNSTALGYFSQTTKANQVVLGTATEEVFVPGRLVSDSLGIEDVITSAGHGFIVGYVLRHNGIAFALAQADTSANAEVIGIVSHVADADTYTLRYVGKITGLTGLTAGTVYYLSQVSAGNVTNVEPVAGISKPILWATSATTAIFHNMRGLLI